MDLQRDQLRQQRTSDSVPLILDFRSWIFDFGFSDEDLKVQTIAD